MPCLEQRLDAENNGLQKALLVGCAEIRGK
jgi:hypothetical protein